MNFRRWTITSLALLTGLLAAQFIAFRQPAVYKFALRGYGFDSGCWVRTPPRIIILGSSKARHAIVPEIIAERNGLRPGEAVNLGVTAGTPLQMLNTYTKNRERFSAASIVYYSVEPWVFNEKFYRYGYERVFLSFRQWRYLSREQNVSDNYFFPLNIFTEGMKCHCQDNSAHSGYRQLEPGYIRDYRPGEFRMDYAPASLFPISGLQLESLQKIKSLAEESGGKFILVLIPSRDIWFEAYKKEMREYDRALVAELNGKLGAPTVVGSFDAKRYDLTDKDFLDDIHTSDSGARSFTGAVFSHTEQHRRLEPRTIRPLYSY